MKNVIVPSSSRRIRIALLTPGPLGISPGQRFRFEHYLPLLKEHNIDYWVFPFFCTKGWNVLHKNGHTLLKLYYVLCGIVHRVATIAKIVRSDFVYIYREAAPIGPPVIEWIIAKCLRKKIVYDFDDAIWLPGVSPQNWLAGYVKCSWKVQIICRIAKRVTVGNEFLANFARSFSNNVAVVPTVVDTNHAHNRLRAHSNSKVVIGWTGSFSTLRYLELISSVIGKLQQELDIIFLVIADRDPLLKMGNYEFVRWRSISEIDDLLRIDIGIMPLDKGENELGKCGFKAIQYMALGIPAIVTPIGVNTKVVDHGVNGFHADSNDDWEKYLRLLIGNIKLRQELGRNGREKIVKEYSVVSSFPAFYSSFNDE
jgi:glycosyltransferase involved in cell wall biosynthesis